MTKSEYDANSTIRGVKTYGERRAPARRSQWLSKEALVMYALIALSWGSAIYLAAVK